MIEISSVFLGQLTNIADTVGGPLNTVFGQGGTGENALVNLGIFFYERFLTIIDIVAIVTIIRSGLRLVYRPEEEQLTRSKRVIASSIAAVMLAHLTQRLVESFYDVSSIGLPTAGACTLATEIYGIIRWAEVLVATVAILIIIISGLKTVISYGSEEGTTQLRKTVFAVIAGCLVIVLSTVIRAALGITEDCSAILGSPDAIPIVSKIIEIISGLLSFLALVAVCISVYAGIMMIANFGSEEEFTKSKSLLFRMVAGLIIVLVSLSLVNFVVAIF
jgi:hypothetical protein